MMLIPIQTSPRLPPIALHCSNAGREGATVAEPRGARVAPRTPGPGIHQPSICSRAFVKIAIGLWNKRQTLMPGSSAEIRL